MIDSRLRNNSADSILDALLPRPSTLRLLEGTCHVRGLTVDAAALDAPEAAALTELMRLWPRRADAASTTRGSSGPDGVRLIVRVEGAMPAGNEEPAMQAYRLRVLPTQIELTGATPPGVFHGLQTLRQLAILCGPTWPCLEIEDRPALAVRGVSYDVSRGKVPTLDTLKVMADRLALLKINQLQLYVEHTFAFAFDPDISAGCSPLTPDEIRALDTWCRARRIELVPSLASFGHMARILSLPQYRHLAEVSPETSWEQMSWHQRVRGLTLDVSNPESRELLRRMYAEYLPLFSSRRVNVCCDETYDLGKGRGARRSAELGPGGLFLEHVCWLREVCAGHGKQIMIWGDMLLKYPELIDRLPKDVIVLNWGYDANVDYASTGRFTAAGLTAWVCPGTSGWNRFAHDINVAEINIRGQVAAARDYGAEGLLITDWGDDGHVAPPAAAWHPLTLAAALAWNADGPTNGTFDRAFGHLFLGDGGPEAVQAWRDAIAASPVSRIWPLFYAPLVDTDGQTNGASSVCRRPRPAVTGSPLPVDRAALAAFDGVALERWRELAEEAARAFAAVRPRDHVAARDRDELILAFNLHALAARRLRLGQHLNVPRPEALSSTSVSRARTPDESQRAAAAPRGQSPTPEALSAGLSHLAETLETIIPAFETLWLARHKPSRLREVTAVLRDLAEQARALARSGADE